MSRIAIVCMPAIGHITPAAAVGRALMARGHDVLMPQVPSARPRVKASGVRFAPLGREMPSMPLTARLLHRAGYPQGRSFLAQAFRVLAEAPALLQRERVDAVIGDQADLAAGSVAEHLGVPFASLCFFPPFHLDPSVPPSIFGWPHADTRLARCRNRLGNRVLAAALAPALSLVNERRQAWALRPFADVNEAFAQGPVIAQIPEALDFPRRNHPSHLHYAAPFHDGRGELAIDFPWDRLPAGDFVYASMGTLQNGNHHVFRTIAEACARAGVPLVMSLGGGCEPEDLGALPGNPVVVDYAPQMQVLARARAVITHGGMNTTLEALMHGVPIVVIPVADDQPGVAARVEWVGAGQAVPLRALTAEGLVHALRRVLYLPRHRDAAERMQRAMTALSGVARAADLIEHHCVARHRAAS